MIPLGTGPVVALCDPTDALNARAARDLRRLSRQPLVTGVPILTEACALLPYAVQRRRLRRFLTDFSVASYQMEDEETLWLEVLDWTYDREFTSIWRRPDGRPIPLAVK